MDALAEDKVLLKITIISDNSSLRPGKWISVTRKFIREYTDLGFTKIILGGGHKILVAFVILIQILL
jgi:hypothetical protein